MWENLMSREVIHYKLFLRCETKVYTPRKRDGERFYTVNFYLGKWFWSIQYRFAGKRLLVDSSVQCLTLSSLTARCNSRTALIYMKTKGRCTFVASVASLLSGAEKKTWRISHFRDRADRQPSWLLAFRATTLRPLRASWPNVTNY